MKDNILSEVRELVTKYPNDMELGEKVRQLMRNKDDKWRIEQFNRNRAPEDQVKTIEEMEERIKNMWPETTEQAWNGEL
jgi:hypothetical protein